MAHARGLWLAGALLVVCGGCASFSEVRFEVEPSALDYVIIRCHAPGTTSEAIWLQLTGSGHLEVRQGTSKRVSDDMWGSPDEANWGDYRVNRVALDPDETQRAFQWLVDAGFFDKSKTPPIRVNETYFDIASQVAFEKNRRVISGEQYQKLFTVLYKAGTR